MTIRAMTLEDLRLVLGWAAEEGWNPGLDDAEAMLAADPQGFLIKTVDGEPVAAISVVNHDPRFAFLGLYLCKPDHRGQGHGLEVWRAGIAHAGTRSIGLDGVPQQQENYEKSGFVKHGSTVRYKGWISTALDPSVRPASPDETEALIVYDARCCGMDRTAFSTAWFSTSRNRQTMVVTHGGEISGYATFRRCGLGTKIGPLNATSHADTQALLASNPFANGDQPVFVDVQQQSSPLCALLQERGFEPVFETARMFNGACPEAHPAAFHAIATMELG
ncbi:L-amino acid N-acyltransferase YncA [Litoreibacter ponti]|uniref:L-amino acid N-acyltransferase YncA n=1 Tax=Litoreibacter ponti TaxID=1510457 RepID=A0A2T6BCK3_9RHOB|nr:GNAT family N-acetyltransferase [Litoreibacter ponti]PTX53793.1 L-amino acid N-acyltransferase YncA [Litoreibacter ponti]